MPYQVEVDKDVCISAGKCVADHPAAFRFDEDEIAEPASGAAEAPDEDLLDAARNCPSGAILLRDASGNPVPV